MSAVPLERTESRRWPTTTSSFATLRKSFGDHLVLDHVSFFVDPGETCVIMGRSGVGKSVTLKHILGFSSRTRAA